VDCLRRRESDVVPQVRALREQTHQLLVR
jgi:hypothetical protein